MRYFFLYVILVIMMSACGSNGLSKQSSGKNIENSSKRSFANTSIVQSVSKNSIFVDGTYYTVTDSFQISSKSDTPIEMNDLKSGDLITYEDTGMIMESFPSKGFIKKIELYDDAVSKKLSKAIGHLLENQKTGDIISPRIQSFSEGILTLRFNEMETNGRMYEAIIDAETLTFEVKEIVNEAVKKRVEDVKKAQLNRKDIMYSGFITEINESEYRINHIDFSVDSSDPIKYKNSQEDKITKNDFEIGSFVTTLSHRKYMLFDKL